MLSLPEYPLHTRESESSPQVWDFIRRRWVALQPEEVVRQRLLRWLIEEKGVPPVLIGVEKQIRYYSLNKRFDVAVFDRLGKAWLLCECKAPDVPLGENACLQLLRYNSTLGAPWLLVTNGHMVQCMQRQTDGQSQWVQDIPLFG